MPRVATYLCCVCGKPAQYRAKITRARLDPLGNNARMTKASGLVEYYCIEHIRLANLAQHSS